MTLPVYVINLDRSRERWERAAGQLDCLNIPYTRVPAVDGARLSKGEIQMHGKKKGVLYRWIRDPSSAEIGAYLSHKKAWQRIRGSDHPGGFVFEDDFVARGDLPVVLDAIGKLQIETPALIKLYIPESRASRFWECRRVLSAPLVVEHQITMPAYVRWGMVAYYVNRAGAARLVESPATCNRPVDDLVRRPWETGVTVLHVTGRPVMHADGPSIIGSPRREAQLAANKGLYRELFNAEFLLMNVMHLPVNLLRGRRVLSGMGL